MNGETILLRLKEFELLFTLASYVGKTFSREQLIEEIWGYDYEEMNEQLMSISKEYENAFHRRRVALSFAPFVVLVTAWN